MGISRKSLIHNIQVTVIDTGSSNFSTIDEDQGNEAISASCVKNWKNNGTDVRKIVCKGSTIEGIGRIEVFYASIQITLSKSMYIMRRNIDSDLPK